MGHEPKPGTPQIRAAQLTDLDAVETLENAVFVSDQLSRRSLRYYIGTPSARFLVLDLDGMVAGDAIIAFRKGSTLARLYSIAIDPGHTGRGFGRLLLQACEEAAAVHGCRALRLEVRSNNAAAIQLYRRAGYREFGLYPDYYEDGAAALRFGDLTRASLRDCPLVPGVEAAIERLGLARIPCAVVSAADRTDVVALLRPRNLAGAFRAICGGDRSKADHIRALLAQGTIAAPLVFFGDSALDMEAAEATGCRFIFVAGVSEWIGGRAIVDQRGHETIEDFTALSWV